MATHLLVGPHPSWDCDWSCHLFLRPIRSSLISFVYEYNPPPLLQCCFWVQVCNYLRVHESHLPDQEGGVALFIVACDCEIPIVGDTVWIGPVLVTLDLQNKQSILFTVQCMLDNHKYMHFIYWTIAISYAPCFWHFGDPFSPEQHSCSYNRFSCGLTVCILLYVW